MIGSALGPYRILEQLGAGGMGEVYLAEDTRLGRKVAIKVLPAEFARDPERLARFEQEAKAAAALNHPHIAAVFDVGSEVMRGEADASGADADASGADGAPGEGAEGAEGAARDDREGTGSAASAPTHFMVQEYLEGHTLRTPLNKGAMPIGKALGLAREIAEALSAAHGAGIVHRDLKPDNVFVTKDGHAKVLDFGLAKLTELAVPGGKEISMSPTVLGTVAGQVMGTAGYMSPEQIDGDGTIDGRSDIFAFGCLLYEMTGGQRAFSGESVLDTLHAITRTNPLPVGEINAELPVDLERIIKKCLAKDRDHRYQHAEDVVVDIKNLAAEVEAGTVRTVADRAAAGRAAPAAAGGLSWKVAVPGAVAIALVAASAAWFIAPGPSLPAAPIVRFSVPLPEGVGFSFFGRRVVAISPDGTRLAFVGRGQVWLRDMDDTVAVPLRGTEQGGRGPFFSPDGEWVGFWRSGELLKVPVGGGQPVKLCDAPENVNGASWGAGNRIVYAQLENGIWSVSSDGGEPEQVIASANGATTDGPQVLPDGSTILYTLLAGNARTWDDGQVVVQAPGEAEPTVIVPAGHGAVYLDTGHIVYAQQGALFARPFDPASREMGGAVPLQQGVADAGVASGASHFAVSSRGDLVYVPGELETGIVTSLVWRDGSGGKETLLEAEGLLWTPRISPDGRFVAYRLQAGDRSDMFIYDIERGISSLFTPDDGARSFAWSPDGKWIYFSADTADEGVNVFRRPADMSTDAEVLIGGPGNELVRSVSPDGEWLLIADTDTLNTGGYDITIYSVSEGGDPLPVFDREVREITAAFSPDGKWIAYVSEETGTREVYVQGYPNLGGKTQVSDGGGQEPVWSPDASRLYYKVDGDIYYVDILGASPFRPSAPSLFLENVHPSGLFQNAGMTDVARDGSRLLTVDLGAPEDTEQLFEVVINWFEELRERVPTGR